MAKKLALGFVGLIVLLAIISSLGGSDTETAPAAEASSAPSASASTAPSESPEPSPTPDYSAQRAYLSEVQALNQQLQDAVQELSTRFTAFGDDMSLFYDNDWRTAVGLNLGIMQVVYNEAQALSPPEDMGIIHGKLLEAYGHANLASDYYTRGLDARDVDLITQGTAEIQIARGNMQELATLLQEYRESHGL